MSEKKFPDDFIIPGSFENGLKPRLGREAWLDPYFRAALATKQGAFVDIGANRGQTLAKLLSISHDREYVGFEPQIDGSFFINRLIEDNQLENCVILPIGLSNLTGVVTLRSRSDDKGLTASAVDGFRPETFYDRTARIFVSRGDDVIAQLGMNKISVVKIDVEGGELEAIEGLGETLSTHTPCIFFEILNHFLAATGEPISKDTIRFRTERNEKLEAIIRNLGYRIFNLPANQPMQEVQKIEPGEKQDLDDVNFLAVHADFVDVYTERLAEAQEPRVD